MDNGAAGYGYDELADVEGKPAKQDNFEIELHFFGSPWGGSD